MCAMFTTAVEGKPCMVTWKLTVAAVIVLLASRVSAKSIVAVPLPLASAPAMGGVSCAGVSAAVNRTAFGLVGGGDERLELEQPAARSRPTMAMARRFMCSDAPFLLSRRTCA